MAGGGGGAGGSIFISSTFHSSYGLITANKGFKGNCTCGVGFGADGSDGRIAFISSNGNNPISSPTANQGISNPISGVIYNWSNGMSGSDIIVPPVIVESSSQPIVNNNIKLIKNTNNLFITSS